MKLCDARVNKKYKITKVNDCYLYSRLLEIGFVEGENVLILQKSPLKKMFLLGFRNSTIALDYDTLSCIEVN